MAKDRINPKLIPLIRPIEGLRPDPDNARAHDERNLTTIMRSLELFGQQKPIVSRPDGTVVAGSGLLLAARRLGWTQIAVVDTDLEGKAIKGYAIADNRTAELAEWDGDILARTMQDLDIPAADLGFTEEDMAAITGERLVPDALEDFDTSPRPKPTWVLIETDQVGAATLERFFRESQLIGRLERSDLAPGEEGRTDD